MLNKTNTQYFPLVSVAIAIYNGDKFLREQLDSLLAQTYSNLEIIISDDNSNDLTQNILEEYSNRDKRVHWSISKRQRGMVPNFMEAISICKGEIIFLCDCDDIWYPEKISKHVDLYKDESVKWVYNKALITDEFNNPTGFLTDTMPDYYEKSRQKFLYYTWGSCIIGCATSYRAGLLKNILMADKFAPGHDSWIQLAIFPAKSGFIDEVLQLYRQHSNNTIGLKKGDENLAIKNNLIYLKSLIKNKQLVLWKRVFLFIVLIAKKIRSLLKNNNYEY